MADDSDLEAWYRDERPGLVRALWAISGDVDLSADVVDEAFSRALARWWRVSSMASLPLRQREVIVLRYVADYTEAATAVALGISEGAASASLAKARRHLAAALGASEEVRAT